MLRPLLLFLLTMLIAPSLHATGLEGPLALRDIYARQVDRKLVLPEPEQAFYAAQLSLTLQQAGLQQLPAQYLLLVDRSPQVQAIMLFWLPDTGVAEFIGASPTSTGKPNGFEYFVTPLGIFNHATANEDFRSEGTLNGYNIRGYGQKGMRVYDFGWVTAPQSWRNGKGPMRLQLHTTDPDYLEPLLGTIQSKGCVRIPASLNRLIDHYGLLDAGYERGLAKGRHFWLLLPDREPTPWSGQYMVVIDSQRTERPNWSPLPLKVPGPESSPSASQVLNTAK